MYVFVQIHDMLHGAKIKQTPGQMYGAYDCLTEGEFHHKYTF